MALNVKMATVFLRNGNVMVTMIVMTKAMKIIVVCIQYLLAICIFVLGVLILICNSLCNICPNCHGLENKHAELDMQNDEEITEIYYVIKNN